MNAQSIFHSLLICDVIGQISHLAENIYIKCNGFGKLDNGRNAQREVMISFTDLQLIKQLFKGRLDDDDV